MEEAEAGHWRRVNDELRSGPPAALVRDGFRRMGLTPREDEVLAALDGYAAAVANWAVPFPDARGTLARLRNEGYLLGLLSNTWWAAGWHDADLAAHGLAGLLDVVAYTSDLPRSKPHPSVFRIVASRLGVEPAECVMVGDRLVDDVSGAMGAGITQSGSETPPRGTTPSSTACAPRRRSNGWTRYRGCSRSAKDRDR